MSELNDYVGLKAGAGGGAGPAPASAAPGAGRRAGGVTHAAGGGYDARGLEDLLGQDLHRQYAERIEVRRAVHPSLRDLPTAELVAIHGYSRDGYAPINAALRSRDAEGLRKYAPYIEAAGSGLRRLPDFAGEVYRRTWLGPEVLAGYREGGFVTERGFLSTTAATHCEYSGNVQYVIQSRRGKDISQIAEHGNEREVLFPPDTRFKVVSVERDARGLTTIRMDEV